MEAIECVSGDAPLGQVALDQKERQLVLCRREPATVLLEGSAVRARLPERLPVGDDAADLLAEALDRVAKRTVLTLRRHRDHRFDTCDPLPR